VSAELSPELIDYFEAKKFPQIRVYLTYDAQDNQLLE